MTTMHEMDNVNEYFMKTLNTIKELTSCDQIQKIALARQQQKSIRNSRIH
jgi:hypothetical protein